MSRDSKGDARVNRGEAASHSSTSRPRCVDQVANPWVAAAPTWAVCPADGKVLLALGPLPPRRLRAGYHRRASAREDSGGSRAARSVSIRSGPVSLGHTGVFRVNLHVAAFTRAVDDHLSRCVGGRPAWPPDSGRSLGIKLVNWAVDPATVPEPPGRAPDGARRRR